MHKDKRTCSGKIISEKKIGRFPLVTEIKTPVSRVLKLGFLPILYYRKHYLYPLKNLRFISNHVTFITHINSLCKKTQKSCTLWITHSLGGGTATYSERQFKELANATLVVCLQYFAEFDCYILSTPNRELGFCILPALQQLHTLSVNAIVTNNLVGFPNVLGMLQYISKLKSNNFNITVSFRTHDYHCLCPEYTLLDNNNLFCELKQLDNCSQCLSKKNLQPLLHAGFKDIYSWRNSWKQFFAHTVDEVICFSEATKPLFTRVYPMLEDKIKVIPHKIHPYPVLSIPPHDTINIGILGDISSVCKGKKIIEQMGIINTNPLVRLILIGPGKPTVGLNVLGRYEPNDLPQLITEQKIDIIFIPSIWPETFSYTTAEAMEMGLPIACYDIWGSAPVLRIKRYSKGLVLREINPKQNLEDIITFIKQQYKEN